MSELARNRLYELIEKKYGLLIKKLAYEILADENDLEDIQQEVFMRCMPYIDKCDEYSLGAVKNYICVAAKNTAINLKKNKMLDEEKIKKYYEAHLTMDKIDFKAFEDKYGHSLEVQELLSCLDNIDKDILSLKYDQGFSDEEIAKALGKSVCAVQKRCYRAKIKLIGILLDHRRD